MSTTANTIDRTGGHLGDTVRALRTGAGITRAQLAGMADCSLSMLASIEQGAVPHRSEVLTRVLHVLEAEAAA